MFEFPVPSGTKIELNGHKDKGKLVDAFKALYGKRQPEYRQQVDEVWCCYAFLRESMQQGLLDFEFTIEKSESPDFKLLRNGKCFMGVEHARGCVERILHAYNRMEKCPDGTMLELPEYYGKEISPKEVMNGVRLPGKKLESSGWGDSGREKAWAKTICDAIKGKMLLSAKPHFQRFEQNELIVHDLTGLLLGMSRYNEALYELRIHYKNIDLGQTDKMYAFDKVHVVVPSPGVLYDVLKEH